MQEAFIKKLIDFQLKKLERMRRLDYLLLQGREDFREDSPSYDVESYIETHLWLNDNVQVLLLLGNTGAGKTTTLRQLAYQLCQNYKHSQPVPIWISLDNPSLIEHHHDLLNTFFKSINHEFDINGLQSDYTFHLLLDGFDELPEAKRQENLFNINNWKNWNLKLLISCRTLAVVGIDDDYKRLFMPTDENDFFKYQALKELVLVPLTNQLQLTYFKQYCEHYKDQLKSPWDKPQAYLNILEQTEELKALASNPQLLYVLLRILPKYPLEELKQADRYDVLGKYIEKCIMLHIEREANKFQRQALSPASYRTFEQGLLTFAQALARQLFCEDDAFKAYQPGINKLIYRPQAENNPWRHFFAGPTYQPWQHKGCLLLETHGEDEHGRFVEYSFLHKAVLEYFVLQTILQEIEQAYVATSVGNYWDANKIYSLTLNQKYLQLEADLFKALVKRLAAKPTYETRLIELVLTSRSRPDCKIAAANAMSLLNQMGFNFSGLNLDGIQVPGAYLHGALLDNTSLKQADLRGAQLHNSFLHRTQLTQSRLAGVAFGQRPYMQHSGSVTAIAYSPDGTLLASGSGDKFIRLWDMQGNLLKSFEGHTKIISGVAFILDGKALVSSCYDRTIRVWDMEGNSSKVIEGHTLPVTCIAYSPKTNILASGSEDNTIRLWNIAQGTLLKTLEGHSRKVTSIAFSPDGKILASGSEDKTICLWDMAKGILLKTLEGHRDKINCIAFSPDGKSLASGSYDKTIRLWTMDGSLLKVLEGLTHSVDSIAFSPDGKTLASGGWNNMVLLWSAKGTFLRTLEGHTGRMVSLTFSPDSKSLVSGSWDNTARVWDVESTLLKPIERHTGTVGTITFSPDGNIIASGSWDDTVRLWDIRGNLLKTLVGHNNIVHHITFSPDGKLLASASEDKTICLWDVVHGTLLRTLKEHSKAIHGVAFSPDGKLLASRSSDQTICLWNREGTLLKKLEGHSDWIWSIAFSPDGNCLASGGDITIRLWDVAKGTLIKTLEGHTDKISRIVFSPDGKLLASASSDKTIRLWTAEGNFLKVLEGHSKYISSIIFSPDSRVLASGSHDHTVRLWNTEGDLLRILEGHTNMVNGVTFSRDGKILASRGVDKTICLWNIAGDLLKLLKGHTASVDSFAFSPDGHILASGSADKSIQTWYIEWKDNSINAKLAWSTHRYLNTQQANLANAINLSPINVQLLRQYGAIEVPSKLTAENFQLSQVKTEQIIAYLSSVDTYKPLAVSYRAKPLLTTMNNWQLIKLEKPELICLLLIGLVKNKPYIKLIYEKDKRLPILVITVEAAERLLQDKDTKFASTIVNENVALTIIKQAQEGVIPPITAILPAGFSAKTYTFSLLQQLQQPSQLKPQLIGKSEEDKLQQLDELLSTLSHCYDLDLSGQQFSDSVLFRLLGHPALCQQLEILRLSHNHLTQKSLLKLLSCLTSVFPKLKQLLLDNNWITFDATIADLLVKPALNRASIQNIDLSMNYIARGVILDGIHANGKTQIMLYGYKTWCGDRLPDYAIEERRKKPNDPTERIPKETCKQLFFQDSKVNSIYLASVSSCLAPHTEFTITPNQGVVGLFANKPFRKQSIFSSARGEHAFLILEGMHKFNQRYLIRADLFADKANKIFIQICYLTPEELYQCTKELSVVNCKIVQVQQETLKCLRNEITAFRDKQDAYSYSATPRRNNQYSCISWAVEMLEKVGIMKDGKVNHWLPSSEVNNAPSYWFF